MAISGSVDKILSTFTLFFPLLLFLILIATAAADDTIEGGSVIFTVNSKFTGMNHSLSLLKAHNNLHHAQILAAGVDVPIGGTGRPDTDGLHYARIGIGTAPREYYVQVDTESDIMWINCIKCKKCPRRGYHGIKVSVVFFFVLILLNI